jgi:hypothetical protein
MLALLRPPPPLQLQLLLNLLKLIRRQSQPSGQLMTSLHRWRKKLLLDLPREHVGNIELADDYPSPTRVCVFDVHRSNRRSHPVYVVIRTVNSEIFDG